MPWATRPPRLLVHAWQVDRDLLWDGDDDRLRFVEELLGMPTTPRHPAADVDEVGLGVKRLSITTIPFS
jgi:hypothetical protein